MKNFLCGILAVLIMGSTYVFADNTSVIASYASGFSDKQGTNNFYFCESKSGQVSELIYKVDDNGSKMWITSEGDWPRFTNEATPGGASDADLMFVSPRRGTIHLKGTVKRYKEFIGGSEFGDGVKLSILKNNRVLWSGSIASDQASEAYDVTACVNIGDKIHFRINCGLHNYYDSTEWWPTVDYISNEYVKDEYDPSYFQKNGDTMKELEYDDVSAGYKADDGIAFISDSAVLPSNTYSVVKRFSISEFGRYRVYAGINSNNEMGFGNIVRVSKNGKHIWEQLFVEGERDILDIGVLADKGDYIDVEVAVNLSEGFNKCEWNCEATKYLGKLFKECDTTSGEAYSVLREIPLASFIKKASTSSVNLSSEKYNVKHPMIYNESEKKWNSGLDGEADYVSETEVSPGVTTNAVIDIKLPQDGVLKIGGGLKINNGNSDGVLSKIYLNERLIWSNRVGGEKSLRWDDPFDTVYFLNDIDVITNVKSGDILSFKFNKWRSNYGDDVDISNVKLLYVEGNALSKTTKWKLSKSTVIDTETGVMYKDGNTDTIGISVKDGTSYIDKNEIEKVFGNKAGVVLDEYSDSEKISVRNAAEAAGENVFWAADRMIILYDGIPVFYGYPEDGEIKTQLENGGDLFE